MDRLKFIKGGLTAVAGVVILSILAGVLPAMAGDVPAKVNYQARLTDSSGVPINDSVHDLRFTVMDAATAGTVIGGPYTHPDVTINNGLVNLQVALTAADFSAAGVRYLEVEVGNGLVGADSVFEKLTPRQQLVSVPYAFEATNAATASVGDAAVDFFGTGVSAVTDVTPCMDIEGTNLSIVAGVLNATDTQLSGEQVDDFVNALINDAESVHTGITITYDDANDAMDFMVDDFIRSVGDTTGVMTEDLNLDDGTLVISWDDNKVGIGTTSPGTALEVNGVITATGGTSTDWNNASTLGACDGINTVYDVDGNRYSTVVIGGQCWMSENMRTTQYPDRTAITKGCIAEACGAWDTDTAQYSCPPDAATSNVEDCPAAYRYGENAGAGTGEALGMFYQWSAAMKGSIAELAQGICPEGWHIPTNAEWEILEEYLGSANCRTTTGWECTPAGNKMKTPDKCSVAGDSNCSISGFNALLTGYRNTNSNYNHRGSDTYLWSSSVGVTGAWPRYLHSGCSGVYRVDDSKAFGFSVRCLKD